MFKGCSRSGVACHYHQAGTMVKQEACDGLRKAAYLFQLAWAVGHMRLVGQVKQRLTGHQLVYGAQNGQAADARIKDTNGLPGSSVHVFLGSGLQRSAVSAPGGSQAV